MSRKIMKPICQSVLGALVLMSANTQIHANPRSNQFATVPFLLDNLTVSENSSRVKPNIMLFIDDSGSMSWSPFADRYTRNGEQSRLVVTQNALYAVLDENKQSGVNWGLKTLHNNGKQDLIGYTPDVEDIKQRVGKIKPGGKTPTTRRYYNIVTEMMGHEHTKYRCQKNYIVLLSDGDANVSCNSRGTLDFNYRGNAYFDQNRSPDRYFKARNAAGTGYCIRPGKGVSDAYHEFWDGPKGLSYFSETLANEDFRKGGLDAAGVSWDDPTFRKQTIETFTVGFSSGVREKGLKYLKNGAVEKKNFFQVTDPTKLKDAFAAIVDKALQSSSNYDVKSSGSPVPPSVVGAASSGKNKKPESAIAVQLDSGSWSSQIRFYDIDDVKNSQGNQNIIYKQPDFDGRKTLINAGEKGVHFVDRLSLNNAHGLNNDFFDIENKETNEDEWLSLLRWTARLSTGKEVNQDGKSKGYSQVYREIDGEKRYIGDIMDSRPVSIGEPSNGRQEFLVTAANDGMVHLFQSKNSPAHPYGLKLSYIPATMERGGTLDAGGENVAKTLKELAHEEYGKNVEHPHRYLINGGFTVLGTPVDQNGKRRFFMFGAMGQGGRGAYALNVGGYDRSNNRPVGLNSNESDWDTKVPLFETVKGTEKNKLGYTVSTPKIGRILVDSNNSGSRYVSYAGFLANGYMGQPTQGNVPQGHETALYVYDMLGQNAVTGASISGQEPGTLIKKIEVPNGVGGLSTPVLVDANLDGIYDIAYAGDYGGNMYRFDLRGGQAAWKVTRIFKGSPERPIVAAPTVSYRPARSGKGKTYIVIFGTGSDIYHNDAENKHTQAIYGIYDDIDSQPTETATTGNLLTQTFISDGVDGKARPLYRLTNHKFDPQIHKGWQIELNDFKEGERVVTQAQMILRTAVLETRAYETVVEEITPPADLCIPQQRKIGIKPSSRQIQINSTNGGALTIKDARINFDKRVVNNTPPNGGNGAQIYFANARAFSNSLVSGTYVPAALMDSPINSDGQGGGNGVDKDVGKSATDEKTDVEERKSNACFRSTQNQTFITAQTEGGLSADDVHGPKCGQNIRRISWRELI